MGYKNYKLYLRNPTKRWLTNSIMTFRHMLERLRNDDDFMNRPSVSKPIQSEILQLRDSKSLKVKYSIIAKLILEHFECRGIWVEVLDPETTDTYVTIEVFGYEEDLELCMNVLDYFINGCMMVQDNLQTEYRRLKINARRAGKIETYNARTIAMDFVSRFLKDLEILLSHTEPMIISPDRELKMELIFHYIDLRKKINLKKYRNLTRSTLYSSTAKIGSRDLNRLL